jgi:hypothetical protein
MITNMTNILKIHIENSRSILYDTIKHGDVDVNAFIYANRLISKINYFLKIVYELCKNLKDNHLTNHISIQLKEILIDELNGFRKTCTEFEQDFFQIIDRISEENQFFYKNIFEITIKKFSEYFSIFLQKLELDENFESLIDSMINYLDNKS